MFERYTEKARRVIFAARHAAEQAHCEHIGTEHILYGILREEGETVTRWLNIPADELISKIPMGGAASIEQASPKRRIKLSAQSKRVLAYGAEESEKLGHHIIDAPHLLLGLLREKVTVAEVLLLKHGANLITLRAKYTAECGQPLSAPVTARRKLSFLPRFRRKSEKIESP